jgi:molecular chaperone Hsp33
MDWSKLESYGVEYYCNCSQERFADALRLLHRDELEDMISGIKPVCHYCSKEYDFSPADIQQIIQSQ